MAGLDVMSIDDWIEAIRELFKSFDEDDPGNNLYTRMCTKMLYRNNFTYVLWEEFHVKMLDVILDNYVQLDIDGEIEKFHKIMKFLSMCTYVSKEYLPTYRFLAAVLDDGTLSTCRDIRDNPHTMQTIFRKIVDEPLWSFLEGEHERILNVFSSSNSLFLEIQHDALNALKSTKNIKKKTILAKHIFSKHSHFKIAIADYIKKGQDYARISNTWYQFRGCLSMFNVGLYYNNPIDECIFFVKKFIDEPGFDWCQHMDFLDSILGNHYWLDVLLSENALQAIELHIIENGPSQAMEHFRHVVEECMYRNDSKFLNYLRRPGILLKLVRYALQSYVSNVGNILGEIDENGNTRQSFCLIIEKYIAFCKKYKELQNIDRVMVDIASVVNSSQLYEYLANNKVDIQTHVGIPIPDYGMTLFEWDAVVEKLFKTGNFDEFKMIIDKGTEFPIWDFAMSIIITRHLRHVSLGSETIKEFIRIVSMQHPGYDEIVTKMVVVACFHNNRWADADALSFASSKYGFVCGLEKNWAKYCWYQNNVPITNNSYVRAEELNSYLIETSTMNLIHMIAYAIINERHDLIAEILQYARKTQSVNIPTRMWFYEHIENSSVEKVKKMIELYHVNAFGRIEHQSDNIANGSCLAKPMLYCESVNEKKRRRDDDCDGSTVDDDCNGSPKHQREDDDCDYSHLSSNGTLENDTRQSSNVSSKSVVYLVFTGSINEIAM